MKINIRQKLLFFSFIILAGTGFIGYTVYKSHQKLLDSAQLVNHTEQVISQSANILSLSKDIEIASQGFIFVSDSEFLKRYILSKTAFEYIGQLKQLTLDNPIQQKRIDSLLFYMNRYLDFSFKTVELRSKKGLASAMVYDFATQGNQYTENIRRVTKAIQQEEYFLLKQRRIINGRSVITFNRISFIMFIMMALFTIVLVITTGNYLFQNEEKEKRAVELIIANKELVFQNEEKEKRAAELIIANKELVFQNEEKEKRAAELIIADKELVFQNEEKGDRAAELVIANKELVFQNEEKEKRAAELIIANKELVFQNEEKEKRAAELIIADKELVFQNEEKGDRAAELVIANKELVFQNEEKKKRAAELIIANKELVFQNEEKEKRAAELIIADKELVFQNEEKGDRAAELIIANKELVFQNEEKEKRAAELIIANKELVFQNEEKEKRAAELIIANKELVFQNAEKEKRADELVIANKELVFQNEEKEKRAAELIIANNELKKAEQEINKVNSLYAFISQVNQDIVHIKEEEDLFRDSCRIACEYGKFKMAWIGIFDIAAGKINMVDQSGITALDIRLFTDVPYKPDGPQHYLLNTGNYYVSNYIENDAGLESWKKFAADRDIRSCMLLPVKKSGFVIGTFNLYSTEPGFFDEEKIELLSGVTKNISFALDNFTKSKKQKAAEDRVVINEKRFRAIIEKGLDMITLRSAEGAIFYASPSITNVLGYSLEELLQTPAFNLIHPDDLPGLYEETRVILQAPGSSFLRRQRYLHKNGNWIWCEGNVTNMLHEPGVNALVSNFRDISEKKIVETQRAFDRNNMKALINNTEDLMWSMGTDFKLITSNEPFDKMIKRITGKTIEIGNDGFAAGFSPELLQHYNSLFERAFTGESFTVIEHTLLPFEIWSEISFCPIRKGDEVVGTACHSREITQRKKAEEQLKQSEKRLKESQATAHLGSWELNFATDIALWSDEHCRIYGFSPKENKQTQSVWLSFIHPDDLNHIKDTINKTQKTPGDNTLNYRIILKDGTIKHIHSKLRFEFDENKKPVGIYGIVLDVTEMKQTADLLGKSEAFNRGVLNSLSSHIAVIDRLGNIVAVNESWKRFSLENGDTNMQRTGKGSNYFNVCTKSADEGDETALVVLEGIKEVMHTAKTVFYFEYPCHSPKEERWFALRVMKFESDEPMVVMAHQDITQRKLSEQTLIHNNEALQKTNKELDRFVYSVSHDLRSPLTSVMGLVNIIEEESREADTLGYARMIRSCVNRLDAFIKNILSYSRNNRTELEVEKIPLKKTLASIVDMFRNIKAAEGIRFEFNINEQQPFYSDMQRFNTVVENIISNAIKFHTRNTSGRFIKLTGNVEADNLYLSIEDNGIGIAPVHHHKIFGMFFRLSGKVDGSGIGLYIVKEMIEKLQGSIGVNSVEGTGTSFTMVMKNFRLF